MFLLNGSGLDDRGPGRSRAFVVVEARLDFVGQFRVFEHFLVGDEDFPDGLGLAALNEVFDVATDFTDRLVQTLAFGSHRLTLLRIIKALQHLNVGRTDGNTRRSRNGLQHATGSRGVERLGYSSRRWRSLSL